MKGYLIPDLLPGQFHRDEESIKRSRFIVSIAHTPSVESAKAFVDAIKQEFPDATHNCWAYSAGMPGSTAQVGASDDGEPKGTAGRPMLTILEHCEVGELTAVVTRYFGGTLLGTGGLVHAYQDLVKLGLSKLPTREKVPSAIYTLGVAHQHFNHVLSILERGGARILTKEFSYNVTLSVEIADADAERILKSVGEATGGEANIEKQEA